MLGIQSSKEITLGIWCTVFEINHKRHAIFKSNNIKQETLWKKRK